MNNWIDSHCHTYMGGEPLEDVLQRAKEAGVDKIVNIGIDMHTNEKAVEEAESTKDVYATVGFHPHHAKNYKEGDEKKIAEWYKQSDKVLAIGECGYDFFHNKSPFEDQQKVFRIFLDLAVDLGAPFVLHSRNADEEAMKMLKTYLEGGLKIVFHSFTSGPEMAEFGIEHGAYFSFNGICTFKASEDIRSVAEKVPRDRILLETDAPYLAPVPHRGKRNEPGYLPLTGRFLADHLGIPHDEFATLTRNNTLEFYSSEMP